MMKLMYITNKPEVALIAEKYGVDRIFIDLELRGKLERQKNMDTVMSHHTVDDVAVIKKCLKKSELLVRVNSIYEDSEQEINKVIKNGADIVMLPYYKTINEVKKFIKYVGGRAKTMLLCETPEADHIMEDVVKLDGIDEIYLGLNDMHLELKMNFMFELLANGTVDRLAKLIKSSGKVFGFGGIARIGEGTLPASSILAEHLRVGSSRVILARAFCNTSIITDLDQIDEMFKTGVHDMRECEKELLQKDEKFFADNHEKVSEIVGQIVETIRKKKAEANK